MNENGKQKERRNANENLENKKRKMVQKSKHYITHEVQKKFNTREVLLPSCNII